MEAGINQDVLSAFGRMIINLNNSLHKLYLSKGYKAELEKNHIFKQELYKFCSTHCQELRTALSLRGDRFYRCWKYKYYFLSVACNVSYNGKYIDGITIKTDFNSFYKHRFLKELQTEIIPKINFVDLALQTDEIQNQITPDIKYIDFNKINQIQFV